MGTEHRSRRGAQPIAAMKAAPGATFVFDVVRGANAIGRGRFCPLGPYGAIRPLWAQLNVTR